MHGGMSPLAQAAYAQLAAGAPADARGLAAALGGGIGREKVRAALRELVTHGWLDRRRVHLSTGRWRWRWRLAPGRPFDFTRDLRDGPVTAPAPGPAPRAADRAPRGQTRSSHQGPAGGAANLNGVTPLGSNPPTPPRGGGGGRPDRTAPRPGRPPRARRTRRPAPPDEAVALAARIGAVGAADAVALALSQGWPAQVLYGRLNGSFDGARSRDAVLRHRVRELMAAESPPPPPPQRHRPLPPWCGHDSCSRLSRKRQHPVTGAIAPCPECSPYMPVCSRADTSDAGRMTVMSPL